MTKSVTKQSSENVFLKLLSEGKVSACREILSNDPSAIAAFSAQAFELALESGFSNFAKSISQIPDFDINNKQQNPLLIALHYGEKALAVTLIEQGIEPNFIGENGEILLRICLEQELFDVAEKLIECGAEINARDNKGWTNLMWATAKNRPDIVQFLLNHGASFELTSKEGWTALTVAFTKGFKQIEDILSAAGATFPVRFKKDLLMMKYDSGDIEDIKSLLEEGMDVNVVDSNGETLLTRACRDNQTEFVSFLLQKGAKQILPTKFQPLVLAVHNSTNTELLEILLAEKPYPHYDAAILAAVKLQKPSFIECLLNAGANINAHDEKGLTPLMYAAIANSTARIRYLLELGADKGAVDNKGNTARDYTSSFSCSELC